MNRKVFWLFLFSVAFLLLLGKFVYAADECVTNCGNPPIGAGGGGGGGSSDDFRLLFLEDDKDGDGVGDTADNCVFVQNRDQRDSDGDGVGDACDNCGGVFNTDQKDTNGDGIGDACSYIMLNLACHDGVNDTNMNLDADGDCVADSLDNCKYVYNPDQADWNSDGTGNACDSGFAQHCIDVSNSTPECALTKDTDGDTVPDASDNCIYVANSDQAIHAGATLGDACNNDWDADGILNAVDNCPSVKNADQLDSDNDGVGDACMSKFCYVWKRDVDNKLLNEDCLDPEEPFTAHIAMGPVQPPIGDATLAIVTNRGGSTPPAVKVTWTVIAAPGGSKKLITPFEATSAESTKYVRTDAASVLKIDKLGSWTIKMDAELTNGDPLGLGVTTASETMNFTVTEGGGGCNIIAEKTPGYGILVPLAILSGLLFVIRRRK